MEQKEIELLEQEKDILIYIDEVMKLYSDMIKWEKQHQDDPSYNELSVYVKKRKLVLLERLNHYHDFHKTLIGGKKSVILNESHESSTETTIKS